MKQFAILSTTECFTCMKRPCDKMGVTWLPRERIVRLRQTCNNPYLCKKSYLCLDYIVFSLLADITMR